MEYINEGMIVQKMKEYLQENGWEKPDENYPMNRLTNADISQYVDLVAKTNDKVIMIECKGDSPERRKHIQDLYIVFGQVIFLLPLNPNEEVGIAIPSYWKDKLIIKKYFNKIFRQNIRIFLISENIIEY